MPDVETTHLPSYQEFAIRVERAREARGIDRLIAKYYIEVNGGNRGPTDEEVARVADTVREKVGPDLTRVLYDSLVGLTERR